MPLQLVFMLLLLLLLLLLVLMLLQVVGRGGGVELPVRSASVAFSVRTEARAVPSC